MAEKKNLFTYSRNRPLQTVKSQIEQANEQENAPVQASAGQQPSLLERIAKGLTALKLEALNLASPGQAGRRSSIFGFGGGQKSPLQELQAIAGEPLHFEQWLQTFSHCHPNGSKIGESSFSEVFLYQADDGAAVAVKIMPLEQEKRSSLGVSPEPVAMAAALHEVRVLRALSGLADERKYTVPIGYTGFNRLHSAHLVRGPYPAELIAHWDGYGKKSENTRPGSLQALKG